MIKNCLRVGLPLVGSCLSMIAHAAVYTASASTITKVDTYTQYGGGDVIFFMANNSLSAMCPYGFWIRATDAGAKTTVAQILAAYQAGTPVVVSADPSITWSGAGSASCLVWDVIGQ
jgi:hypothetical protein